MNARPLLASALVLACASASTASPRQDYTLNCMGCHRANGAGTPPVIPQLAGRIGYYLQVPAGRAYLVQVPGAAQSLLDDAALAAVLNWMLTEFGGESLTRGFDPYTAEEVGRYRTDRPSDLSELRRRLAARVADVASYGH